jgi:hypothetical protein
MESKFISYIEMVKSDIASMVYSEGGGATFEDMYTEYCIEKLEDIGKTEGARVLSYVHPDSQGRIEWKINGYAFRDESKEESGKNYYETLDLFITYFDTTSYEYNISSNDFTKGINQVKKFLNAALKGHINYIDSANSELINVIKILSRQSDLLDRTNIFFLINGNSNHTNEKTSIKGLDDLDISIHVWDIKRFYKLFESNSNREPIQINFSDYSNDQSLGIQCLKVPNTNELYECFLAIVRGDILAALYKNYSNELLESNVRAFLGQAGKYNKGIKETIIEKPDMFLPYNNGITATAESVETVIIGNTSYITKLNDFQIVNGGQTTASLFHTQKKFKHADLSKVFVQMKLTVIKDQNQKNIEVPNIARYANSQNKVTELDLSSNNQYFIAIENLSRRKYVVNPENRNQSTLWYFERVNGQYRESLNKIEKRSQAKFKEQNPTNQKIVKSDIAKYINIWEQEPHFVSQGSQKNFVQYVKKINDLLKRKKVPGENFYKKLISNAILYKTLDKSFGRSGADAIGDTNLKVFAVTYSLSYFHFKTNNRLDLWKIYDSQKVEQELSVFLKNLMVIIFNYITEAAKNTLISEYAKRESTWNQIKSTEFDINFNSIEKYLISVEERDRREVEQELPKSNIEDEVVIKDQILKLGIKFWDGLKLYIRGNKLFEEIEFDLWDVIHNLNSGKNLNQKNLNIADKALNIIQEHHLNVEEIKSLSQKDDSSNNTSLKAIYDRMNLMTPSDWSKFIDLVNQTRSAEESEIFNLKSVSLMILKKDKSIRENSLLKAHETLLKISKRFGLKY